MVWKSTAVSLVIITHIIYVFGKFGYYSKLGFLHLLFCSDLKKVWLGFLVCVTPNIVVPSTKAIILNLFMSSPMKWVTTWVWTMMGNQIRVIIVIQTSTLCLLFWVRAKSLGPLVQIKNYSNFLQPGKCSSLKNMKKGGTLWKKMCNIYSNNLKTNNIMFLNALEKLRYLKKIYLLPLSKVEQFMHRIT